MAERTQSVVEAYEKTAATIIKNLKKRNMEGHWCPTREDAAELVLSMMGDGDSVTWGGTETFKESGVKDAITESGRFRLLDRTTPTTPEEKREMWRDRASADWFFMSANAITTSGEIVNIDGNSDRCSLLLHGPEHVVLLVGMNKVVADVEAGFKRIRTAVCPLNASRLHTATPCEITGVCAECHAPMCMCCNMVVTRHVRQTGRIKVVLIGEELGY